MVQDPSWRVWGLIGITVLGACSSSTTPSLAGSSDGGRDASTGADAGAPQDAGDSGRRDAGDASSSDAGMVCDDAMADGCVAPEPACGDGLLNVVGEECDDGNDVSDDGCTATCTRDPDFDCPAPGEPCVYTVVCGDGKISGPETCDDGNGREGDGCSDSCVVEPGYDCPVVGLRCRAKECGDGIVAGFEECDFVESVVGCTDCRIDSGYDCDDTSCAPTTCGDGDIERGEQCDDGADDAPFDGCFECRSEPKCNDGVCTPVCGDGQRFAGEACDDGNLRAGDGCSPECEVETGYTCTDQLGAPPENVSLPILLRDFIGRNRSLKDTDACDDPIDVPDTTNPCYHLDFNGMRGDIVQGVLEDELDANGRPVYVCPDPQNGCIQNPGHNPNGGRYTFNGPRWFNQWYDSSSPNAYEVVSSVTLDRDGDIYVYDSAPLGGFYPLGEGGWVAEGSESTTRNCSNTMDVNVSFTTETHFWFEYQGGERFEFVGDDDLWVFVDGRLLLDLGGLHGARTARFTLGPIDDGSDGSIETPVGTARVQDDVRHSLGDPEDYAEEDLGMTIGGVYEVVMFHAERNQCGSNFKVTLKDFNRPKSECASECGDGVVASDEVCDEGDANADPAPYGGCSADCSRRGSYCGDGVTDSDAGEACDDGFNVTVYRQAEGDCAPKCTEPAYCGDGLVQSGFGEQCDDGYNDGGYGECAPGCLLGPRCGDGEVQADQEECDDGNLDSFDGCNVNCKIDRILI